MGYWWECEMVLLVWKTAWWFLKQLDIDLLYHPAFLLLGIYLGETIACVSQKLTHNVHSSAIPNSQKVEVTQVSINGWMKSEMWREYMMAHC